MDNIAIKKLKEALDEYVSDCEDCAGGVCTMNCGPATCDVPFKTVYERLTGKHYLSISAKSRAEIKTICTQYPEIMNSGLSDNYAKFEYNTDWGLRDCDVPDRFVVGTTFRYHTGGISLCHVRGFVDGLCVYRWWGRCKPRWFYDTQYVDVLEKFAEDIKPPKSC